MAEYGARESSVYRGRASMAQPRPSGTTLGPALYTLMGRLSRALAGPHDAPLRFTMAKLERSSGHIRIGISGWTYPGWRGTFYPPSLPHRAEMDYAASRFPSIEINGSFYSLQRAAYFRSWYERCADDFLFALTPTPPSSRPTMTTA
jgi:hypothetical protein